MFQLLHRPAHNRKGAPVLVHHLAPKCPALAGLHLEDMMHNNQTFLCMFLILSIRSDDSLLNLSTSSFIHARGRWLVQRRELCLLLGFCSPAPPRRPGRAPPWRSAARAARRGRRALSGAEPPCSHCSTALELGCSLPLSPCI
eukprot:6197210-Pleurochrysis_carterae.AAC.1